MTEPATMRRTGSHVLRGGDHGAAGAGSLRLRRAAPLLIAGVAVLGTSGSALAVNLFSALGPAGTLWIRSVLAGLMLAAIGWRSFRRPTLGQALRLAALGLALAASNLAFYEALGRIPLGVAATLEFTGPLAIAAAGIRRARDLAWPLLAAAGVALLGNPAVHVDLAGFAFALAAGAFWALYILLSKRLVDEVGPVMTIGAAFAVSSLALTPAAAQAAGLLLHLAVMATAMVVAVLSAGLPYLLELVALQAVPASTFSTLLSLEPAAGALMGLAILGQHLRPAELLAVLLVVFASAGASWRTGQPKAAPPRRRRERKAGVTGGFLRVGARLGSARAGLAGWLMCDHRAAARSETSAAAALPRSPC